MLAIDVRDVEKTFRGGVIRRRLTHALRGVDLSVRRGAIFGLLGPNGAGKTTLLSICATLLTPDRGSVTILGHDVRTHARAVRQRLNMASGNASFLWNLRPPEILAFYGRLYGLWGSPLRRRIDELLETFELTEHRRAPYNELSTGLKQRLALAKSVLNDPELLFLDEPTLGLDPDVAARLRRHIAFLRREWGTTIVLTTHYMREAEELCDEIAFIKGGKILARGTANDLKRQIGIGDVVALRVDPSLADVLSASPGVLRCVASNGAMECTVDSASERLPELLRLLDGKGAVVHGVHVREPDLEQVFVELSR